MKILNCPLNGPRNISEFVCLGEVKATPASDAGVDDWVEFVFMERNPAGEIEEWWMHVPTNYLFRVLRDTRTDTILATYPSNDGVQNHPRSSGGKVP